MFNKVCGLSIPVQPSSRQHLQNFFFWLGGPLNASNEYSEVSERTLR